MTAPGNPLNWELFYGQHKDIQSLENGFPSLFVMPWQSMSRSSK